MRARTWILATLLVAAAATPALAQSGPPGACECAAPVAAPAPAPEGWDGRAWSVGLHLASIGLHEEATDAKSEFGGGGLQVRYRANARWELELSTDDGRERVDGAPGDRRLDAGTLAALYHLRPYRRWDVFLLAGFGGTRIYPDGQPDAAEERGHIAAAVGLERHFGRIGVVAELRMLGLSPVERETAPARAGAMADVVADESEGLSGGRLSLAASYRF